VFIRPAQLGDAEAIAVVHVRTWQVAYRGHVPQTHLDRLDPAERRAAWSEGLRAAEPPTATFVLEDADAVIGFVHVSPSRDDDVDPADVGEVNAIYLLPAHWGRGGGRLLLAAGLRALRTAGLTEATLWVMDSNDRARRFYEAAGWRPDGATKTDLAWGFALDQVRYRVCCADGLTALGMLVA
jgi:GNAT superfamily N-acetyltransferase